MKVRGLRVLMYHAIGRTGEDPNMLYTSPELFEAQLLYLKRHNLRGTSVGELLRAERSGNARGLVALTFDDGSEDFLCTALPILERMQFSATVFVVAGMMGRENDWQHYLEPKPTLRILGRDKVREVSERGVEIGAHTLTHPNLCNLEPELREEEVLGSRQLLGEVLGYEVEGFCYPYGGINAEALQNVADAGYAYACSVFSRVNGSVYDLPRIDVSERDSLPIFASKISLHSPYLYGRRELARLKRSIQRVRRGSP